MAHEHLKERGLFGLPPPPTGASPAEYYHLMTSHRNPYGELLMQGAGAAAAHLPEYITPMDGELDWDHRGPLPFTVYLLYLHNRLILSVWEGLECIGTKVETFLRVFLSSIPGDLQW